MLFSQRKGLKPVRTTMQVDSMDDVLKNSLWSALSIFYFKRDLEPPLVSYHKDLQELFTKMWLDYFKKPLDELRNYYPDIYEELRKMFFRYQYNEIYDFIEFITNNYPVDKTNQEFMNYCNIILKRELSAYNFVGGVIAQITSEEEIEEIEQALENTDSLNGVNTHLKTALERLSDRKSPDYRNSIKESISGVESISKLIAKNDKAVLSDALKTIEKGKIVELHPALKKAFDNLYGYTSDAEGIRHSLMEESNLDFEDAKFMLVSCSAFVNYLISKSEKAGIKLDAK